MSIHSGQYVKTHRVVVIAVLSALYFVLSALLHIPVFGKIRLDLGYIALMLAVVLMGAIPGALVGGIGAFLVSLLLHGRVSPGWIAMNLIIGALCGLVLFKRRNIERKKLIPAACIIVTLSMIPAVAVKTLIDCAIDGTPLLLNVSSAIAAGSLDAAVMLILGLPISLTLKDRIKL